MSPNGGYPTICSFLSETPAVGGGFRTYKYSVRRYEPYGSYRRITRSFEIVFLSHAKYIRKILKIKTFVEKSLNC